MVSLVWRSIPRLGGPQIWGVPRPGGALGGRAQDGGPQTGGPQTGGSQTRGPQTHAVTTIPPQTGGLQTRVPRLGDPKLAFFLTTLKAFTLFLPKAAFLDKSLL